MSGKPNGFPLWKHRNGQWCRKRKGKFFYFGTDKDAALLDWIKRKDRILADLPELPDDDGLQLRDILNSFHRSKKQAAEESALTKRSLQEYETVLDTIALTIGAKYPVALLTSDDLTKLRRELIKGKKGGTIAPTSQKRLLAMARSVFLHANEEHDAGIKYKKPLKAPTGKQLRRARHEMGERLFEPAEIRTLLDAASDTLKAMILLGINCGFGNRDCATLPIEQVDLSGGWHNYWRPKTEEPRRCKLWDETVAVLSQIIGDRSSGNVFATQHGNPWYSEEGRNCPISKEVRKLCISTGIYRKNVTTFYTLRRTHYTIGATAGEPAASSFIMGHTPASDDMSAIYRQKHFDASLLKVTNAVHEWLS